MKKIALIFVYLLSLCSFVDARAPLESYKRYMFVLVHGIGAKTNKPHDYVADPEHWHSNDVGRKSSIWDISRDDNALMIPQGNWFGNIGGTLQSRGFLGHVVWYDFYEPWKSPIRGDGSKDYGVSLSQYLGDRDITDNPMGVQGFGKTAQTFWLHEFFPNALDAKEYVTYKEDGNKSFLQLAQKDWELWNEVQKQAGIENQEKPQKYILMAHSMGGLTTRDYLTESFYKGDVDKLITLDSPHEGSGIANYVQYWAENKNNFTDHFLGDYVATMIAAGVANFLIGSPLTRGQIVFAVSCLSVAPLRSALATLFGNFMSDYTGDHIKYGIDVMALNDQKPFGLYQSNTKEFLQKFNNRISLKDEMGNGYQLPYFRLVTASGVPTPGGPGFHKIIGNELSDRTGFSLSPAVFGGILPYAYDGVDGKMNASSWFTIIYKMITAFFTNSLWNDWGSGFVPHWSSEAKNVKIFNDAKADTKKWNISYDGDNSQFLGGFDAVMAEMVALEVAASFFFENPAFKTARCIAYIALTSIYIRLADWEKISHPVNFIGFHGALSKRVDEDKVDEKTGKRLIDDLVWEKPSVSIVYNPVDPQDRTNSNGGRVGISTTRELVEFKKASVKKEDGKNLVDVVWKNETEPHVFDLNLRGALVPDEEKRQKTINIAGWYPNTTIKGLVLKNTQANKVITVDNSNCSAIPTGGWNVVKKQEGALSCVIPMSDEDKGNYTMQLVVDEPADADATYGVMVDVGRTPGATFVEGKSLFDAQNLDWDRYVTFKNRRKQVDKDGNIDASVADMVDYRRASNLVVNKLPRLFEFEVDDLQPDRMNRLSLDFNYGTAKIEFEAGRDPNKFDIPYTYKDKNGNNVEIGENSASHGFVNTAAESYNVTASVGSQSCTFQMSNPVDAWGKWNLDLDEIQGKMKSQCNIDKYQPFLEGQNHIRIFSENRWLMTRSQDLNIFIPGPPPVISLIYPRNGEVFCGPSKLKFDVNLIYGLSSDLTANEVSIYYMDGDQKIEIKPEDLVITAKTGGPNTPSSNTAYEVSTKNEIAWPKESVVSITVKPKILGSSAAPYTYLLQISQDCVAPTVVIDSEQDKYNPTTISFESYDQMENDGVHLSVEDEIIELKSKDKSNSKVHVLMANKFTASGSKVRSIELKDDAGNPLPDGEYELSVRVHDDVVKDESSDVARRDFWNSYNPLPDMTKPFATYCNDGKLSNESNCMTHWSMASIDVVIDKTAPSIENQEFVLQKQVPANQGAQGNLNATEYPFVNNLYAGSALDKNLVLKMEVSDASLNEDNVPDAVVEFIQVDFIGNVLENGHHFSQKMEGEFKNGKFVYSHDVIKSLTEDLRNEMSGYQLVPDGIYSPVIRVADAAKNVTEKRMSPVFVDMNAPRITEMNVPYTVKSGMMHIVTFEADEIMDDPSMVKLGSVHATVTAKCGDKTIPYGQVSSVEKNSKIKYAFEAVIPNDAKGGCIARADVYDINGNVRSGELSFVVDFIPPEITYPEKPVNGTPMDLQGRIVIRGAAENPNLREGGAFTKYELTYAEIDEESNVVGSWSHLGMTVPEGRRCNNTSNVSCNPVVKKGNGNDILGYWDLMKLSSDAKNKIYRIKVETFNEGGFSASDYVDVFVPAEPKEPPTIAFDESTPDKCFFTDKDDVCEIRWKTDFPMEQKSGNVRMEILRMNTNNQSTFVDVERIFNNVIPKEYYGAPKDASAKGAYLWIDKNDLNKIENIYHLRLVAGQLATTYTLTFLKTKGSVLKIYADGNNTNDLSQSIDDTYSSLNVSLKAGETLSYVIKSDAKASVTWSLHGSVVRTGDNASDMKFMYAPNLTDEDYAFVGENSKSIVSLLHQSEVVLPLTSSVNQFLWNGVNDALASVPSGSYRVNLTLEGLEDGVYDVASKDIAVVGRPVVLSNVEATPKQIPFDVSYMENALLKPVHVTFSFNIDQDAAVSAFVRSTEGREPVRELMKLEENGRKVLLDKFYIAGRKNNYLVNWDGHYNNTSQALPGEYEFVVQIHDVKGDVVNEKKASFKITDDHMLVDGDVDLKVDGRNSEHVTMEGKDYQVVEGMNDAILQFAPAGKTIVTDNVTVKARFKGTQLVNTLPFERYSVGVQVHKKSAAFMAVAALSYVYNNKNIFYDEANHSNRIAFYGRVAFYEDNNNEVSFSIPFDSGKDGNDDHEMMRQANAAVFLIPEHCMSEKYLKDNITNTREISFEEKLKNLKKEASVVLIWGSRALNNIEDLATHTCEKKGDTDCPDGLYVYGNSERPIVETPPFYNSSDIYWDRRCDIGIDAPPPNSCVSGNLSDAELEKYLEQYCKEHPSKGCGNRIADKGEPLLGSTDRYDPEKYSADITASAWADRWWNEGGDNKHIKLHVKMKATDRFWGKTVDKNGNTKVIGYGNGNLVNRYLTLDPMNENFLFCDACDFSDNKTPYLNPRHSQRFNLVDPKAGQGQYFISTLHNPSFHNFHVDENNDVNKGIAFENTLRDGVELYFHYFQIKPNHVIYPQTPYDINLTFSEQGIETPQSLEYLGAYDQGSRSIIPYSVGGLGAKDLSIFVDFSLPVNGNVDLNQHQESIPWPIQDVSSIESNCGPAGCGSSINDWELVDPLSVVETENVGCDASDENDRCYKEFTANVTLGSQGLDNGFDMQAQLNEWTQSITAKNPRITITDEQIVVPKGYLVDGSIVRKDASGCDKDGCDYAPNQDPLILYADLDDDGLVSEDGSKVSLTKEMPYDGTLDVDGDLAMGEDPDDAFRVRLPSMSFKFEPGSSSKTNLLAYTLGDLMGNRLTELQANAVSQGKIPGTVADGNSVLLQKPDGSWGDNPVAKTQWEKTNNPKLFDRTKLFYKDGKVNNDVRIVKSENMDDDNAMRGKIWIGPNDFSGRDRRLLEVHAKIPGMQTNEEYKLYASSEVGWIDLTPSKLVKPNSEGFEGLIAYWDVETSGMHQLMLVRTVGGEKKYKTINVYVGAVANENKTLFSDAMGRSQVQVASGSTLFDVIPLGRNEVPQIIPSNNNLGPVVKVYPPISTVDEDVSIRLRFNRNEVDNQGWSSRGSFYVVSDGYSPQCVNGVTWEYYDESDKKVSESSNWSYVIVSGTVPKSGKQKTEQATVKIGENAAFGDATVSVTESSNGVYNVNFNPDVNP